MGKTRPEPLTKEEFAVAHRIFSGERPAANPNSTAIGVAGVR
jgi:hypothetical protein